MLFQSFDPQKQALFHKSFCLLNLVDILKIQTTFVLVFFTIKIYTYSFERSLNDDNIFSFKTKSITQDDKVPEPKTRPYLAEGF